jgi:hypothetical protein
MCVACGAVLDPVAGHDQFVHEGANREGDYRFVDRAEVGHPAIIEFRDPLHGSLAQISDAALPTER